MLDSRYILHILNRFGHIFRTAPKNDNFKVPYTSQRERDASFKMHSSLTRSKHTVCPTENRLSGRIRIALAWHELKRVSQLVNARSWRVARA